MMYSELTHDAFKANRMMCSTQTDHLFGKQKREAEASRTLNFHKSTLDKNHIIVYTSTVLPDILCSLRAMRQERVHCL